MRESRTEESKQWRGRVRRNRVEGSSLNTILQDSGTDPQEHVVVLNLWYGNPTETGNPEIAGTHSEHPQSRSWNLVRFNARRQQATNMLQRSAKVNGESLVCVGADADRLMINASHSLLKRSKVEARFLN